MVGLSGDSVGIMQRSAFILTLSILVPSFAACDRQPKTVVIEERRPLEIAQPVSRSKTFETARLGRAIDAYETAPTARSSADVTDSFAELDGEIAELVGYISKHDGRERAEADRKLTDLRTYRAKENARYTAAQVIAVPTTAVVTPEPAGRNVGRVPEEVEDIARRAGDNVERAAKKVGDGLKDAADAVRDAVR